MKKRIFSAWLLVVYVLSLTSIVSDGFYPAVTAEESEKELVQSASVHHASSGVRLPSKFSPSKATFPQHFEVPASMLIAGTPASAEGETSPAVPRYIMHCIYRL